MQTPQIVDHLAMLFVGLETSFIHIRSPDANGHEIIAPLWDQFLHRMGEVEHRIGEPAYGVIFGCDESKRSHPHELQYLASVPVEKVGKLPQGMTSYKVPASKFACFTHKGPIQNIGATVNEIYDGWLQQDTYEHANVADIELYDGRFCMEDKSEMEYWISIKAKVTRDQTT